MVKLNILLLGAKEYPFGSGLGHEKKPSGGIEVHMEKLAKYLSRDGHRVFIITRRFPGQKAMEKKGNITVYRTSYIKNTLLRTVSFNFAGRKYAKRIIEKENIDIIHAHGPVAGFFASSLSRKKCIPLVFTPHGTITGWNTVIKRFLDTFMKKSIRSSRKTIFVSHVAQAESVARYGKFPHTLIPNAIDPDDYPPKKRTWREPRFLFLGRLEVMKGIDTMLESFRMLLEDFPSARLCIAGDGTMKPGIKRYISENKLSGNIKSLGWVKSPKALSESDIFLLPSWETGQPIALLEAMVSGKIILTSLPYINSKTGISVKVKDSRDLHRKMLLVCRDMKKYRKLGKAARQDALKNHAWKNIIKGIEAVYKEVTCP